jgi:hypothetical protein
MRPRWNNLQPQSSLSNLAASLFSPRCRSPVSSPAMLLTLASPTHRVRMRNMTSSRAGSNTNIPCDPWQIGSCSKDWSAAIPWCRVFSKSRTGELEHSRTGSRERQRFRFHTQFLISLMRFLSPFPLFDTCSVLHQFSRIYTYPCPFLHVWLYDASRTTRHFTSGEQPSLLLPSKKYVC